LASHRIGARRATTRSRRDFEDYDVTYCYSKRRFKSERFPAGRPFNTGCYITETGRDVTLGLRIARDSTDIC
jgi:hypothetical protein